MRLWAKESLAVGLSSLSYDFAQDNGMEQLMIPAATGVDHLEMTSGGYEVGIYIYT